MTRRVVLVGEAPARGRDALPALSASTPSGQTLQRLSGLTPDQWGARVSAVNLIRRSDGWTAAAGRLAARELLMAWAKLSARDWLAVLLGARVQASFFYWASLPAPRPWPTRVSLFGHDVLCLAHPSGRCRWWNDEANRAAAQRELRAALNEGPKS